MSVIYAVHQHTLEHVKIELSTPPFWNNHNWKTIEADDEGWITWPGVKAIPVPIGSFVEIKHRDGGGFGPYVMLETYLDVWEHKNRAFDIVAYRPVLKAERGEARRQAAPQGDKKVKTKTTTTTKTTSFLNEDDIEAILRKHLGLRDVDKVDFDGSFGHMVVIEKEYTEVVE